MASKKSIGRTRKLPHTQSPQRARGSIRIPATVFIALVLAGTAAWAYSTSFAGVLVLDDKFAIADNPNIKTLWPLTTAMSAPAESPVSARPIASLTLAINYALAPPDVRDVLSPGGPASPPEVRERFLRNIWGYHFLNLLIHVLAALTFFGVIRRTLQSVRLRDRFGSASTALAFVASLIWVVHPLLTDAVTYVIQRTELLMGLFFFATLYCSIRAGEPSATGRARRLWTTAAIVACALGMGSKQTMVTAPLIVWLWDRLFLDEEVRSGLEHGADPLPAPAVCGLGRDLGPAGRARRHGAVAAFNWIRTGGMDAMDIPPHADRRHRALRPARDHSVAAGSRLRRLADGHLCV